VGGPASTGEAGGALPVVAAGARPGATRLAELLATAPGPDAGEITDKGYLNQRRVLTERAALVGLLYADPPRLAVPPAD
jgi:feruloyl-CoA synthase